MVVVEEGRRGKLKRRELRFVVGAQPPFAHLQVNVRKEIDALAFEFEVLKQDLRR